jgi:hypothetical protein
VRLILALLGQTVTHAQAEYETKYARRKTVEEAAPAAPEAVAEAAPAPVTEVLAAPVQPAVPPA